MRKETLEKVDAQKTREKEAWHMIEAQSRLLPVNLYEPKRCALDLNERYQGSRKSLRLGN
jgi:hypothetical protein